LASYWYLAWSKLELCNMGINVWNIINNRKIMAWQIHRKTSKYFQKIICNFYCNDKFYNI